ncbi:MAG: protein kinase domain-containing protein [Myxococcota bacterium]
MTDAVADLDKDLPSEEQDTFPRVFGNYLLLHRLARGGMGEVYLAKTGGLAGIEKHCVVKTLRPHFTSDREYVSRFIDEARVVVGLTHRNIAQTFDVGRVGHQYYLAMEYIPGMDARSVQDRYQSTHPGDNVEPGIALHITSEVLEALDYAHRAKNPSTGQLLHLVHRDISPQNVMMNFEGEVKLIDFGLAQSTSKSEHTQPHLVMGKMAYMSPEQARGESIDATADQFAVGVMLYELLTGERYYGQMNPQQIWAVAGRGDWVPPRMGEVPAPLVAIFRRALAPTRDGRFETCGDFREALVEYQYASGTRAGSRELRTLMKKLYAAEQAQHEALVAHYAGVRLADFVEDPWITPSGSVRVPKGVSSKREETVSFLPSPTDGAIRAELVRFATEPPLTRGGERTGETTRVPRAAAGIAQQSHRAMVAGITLALVVVLSVLWWTFLGAKPPAPTPVVTELRPVSPPAVAPADVSVEGTASQQAPTEGHPSPTSSGSTDVPVTAASSPVAPSPPVVAAQEPEPSIVDEPAAMSRPVSPSPRRAKVRRPLSASVIQQEPKRPLDKIRFLQDHCLDRVPCAPRLSKVKNVDPAEILRRHSAGEFDQCIQQCKAE